MYTCEHCEKTLKTKASLAAHQKKSKSCLRNRVKQPRPLVTPVAQYTSQTFCKDLPIREKLSPLLATEAKHDLPIREKLSPLLLATKAKCDLPPKLQKVCEECNYSNRYSAEECTMCLHPFPNPNRGMKKTCKICTFINKYNAEECRACFNPFPRVLNNPDREINVEELKAENASLWKKLDLIGDDLSSLTHYCMRIMSTDGELHYGAVMPMTQTLDLADVERTRRMLEPIFEFIDAHPEVLAMHLAHNMFEGEYELPKYICVDEKEELFGFRNPEGEWVEDLKAEKLMLHLQIAGVKILATREYREKFLKQLVGYAQK